MLTGSATADEWARGYKAEVTGTNWNVERFKYLAVKESAENAWKGKGVAWRLIKKLPEGDWTWPDF